MIIIILLLIPLLILVISMHQLRPQFLVQLQYFNDFYPCFFCQM